MTSIAIVTPYWKGSPGGGVLASVTGLVKELEGRGLDIKIVFREGTDPKNYSIKGSRFMFPFKAFWILRKIKPDIVHSQGSWYCLLSGYLYKKACGARLIHTFRSEPVKKLSVFSRVFMQFLVNRCDCVTFVSKALKDNVEEVWGLRFKKAEITYGGVTPREVTGREIKKFRDKFGLKANSIVLLAQALTANRFKAEGAKLLIGAIGKLKNSYPNIVLLLTREGDYSPELREFVNKSALSDRVIFTGDVANPYIPLAFCDIYTHTPLFMGFGNAVMEAMSVGKPIVATSFKGMDEAIENMRNGILVEADTDEIGQAIERLLNDKALAQRLGENAKRTAAQKFSWKQAADRFLKVYGGCE